MPHGSRSVVACAVAAGAVEAALARTTRSLDLVRAECAMPLPLRAPAEPNGSQPLAAAVLVDAIGRLLPGVLNDETSALFDSFQDDLLAPPVYTRPADFRGMKVPEVLLNGNPKIIDEWRYEQSVERTRKRRPDMLDKT